MNFRIKTKNHAAEETGSPQKIDFRADEPHESHPTALELMEKIS